ncbi:helix-turn-helix domain-containing protein [Polycladomyces subterraneus]|uniref:Helix-turn-helix domain-containing protein n=1 Tax=Polycladomyces subterraneus TaxID=1016997 RepID=A0ABT8IQN2_9BACL|nr:helix-turn-helix transcriptional regulator [Polycladomyces subterraneus]MDN4594419.1 helix-turn-helix domain-containing protein [Polycladomyces subterraneus]
MSAETGRRLKRARESRGLTLEDVSRMTGIEPQYLQAIESGQLGALPGPYVRSYLRSYAQCVGEDPQALIRMYMTGKTTAGNYSADVRTRTRDARAGSIRRRRTNRTEAAASSEEALLQRGSRWDTGKRPSLSRAEQPGSRRRLGTYSRTRSTGGEPESSPPRQQWEEVATVGERTDGQASAPRIEVPADWPDPAELGIRSEEPKTEANEEELLPVAPPDEEESTGSRLSRRSKKQSASHRSSFSRWYTRFLITGAILFVIAAIALGITLYMDNESAPVKQKSTAIASAEGTSTSEQKPILNPTVTSAIAPDHYELVHAKEIQLNIVAVGDATVTIRNQEVGTPIKTWQMKSGDKQTFSYPNDLWITVDIPRNVKITVFGQPVNTDYSNEKKIEIKLIHE